MNVMLVELKTKVILFTYYSHIMAIGKVFDCFRSV